MNTPTIRRLTPLCRHQLSPIARLFALLLGTFITEYRFTKPNDVFVNCLTAFCSISTLSNPPFEAWWDALKWGAFACGFVAIALAWDPGQEAKIRTSTSRMIVYKIVTTLGAAKIIFSLVFLLALLSYFDLSDPKTKVFVLIWGAFLISAFLELPDLARSIFWRKGSAREIVGIAHSFLAPTIVYCRSLGTDRPAIRDFVGFSQTLNGDFHSFGVVIGVRDSASESRHVIALLNTSIDRSGFNDRTLISRIGDAERDQLEASYGRKLVTA